MITKMTAREAEKFLARNRTTQRFRRLLRLPGDSDTRDESAVNR